MIISTYPSDPSDSLESLRTGDILLFHGEHFWFSSLVEYITGSSFSHVAMVLRSPTDIDPSLTGIYMIESGEEMFPDAISHRIRKGVQIVDLKKVIETYTGTIYYRKLEISCETRIITEAVLSNIWPKIINCPYDENPWDLIRAAFDIKWGNNCRDNAFMCSALVSFLYENFGFLEIPIEWDLIQPKDFDENRKIDKICIYELKEKIKINK